MLLLKELLKNLFFNHRLKGIHLDSIVFESSLSFHQSSSSGLTGLFKKSAGEWTCDTCLVQNKSENMKCLACETPKPKATNAGQSQQVRLHRGGTVMINTLELNTN